MIQMNIKYFLAVCISISIFSCQYKSNNNTKAAKQLEDINIQRFEQELFVCENSEDINQLFDKYPFFAPFYTNQILALPGKQVDMQDNLSDFSRDSVIRGVYNLTDSIYGDLTDLEVDLKKAFYNYKETFPEERVPDLYTFISGFVYGIVLFEDDERNNTLGLGLDMFLGNEFPYAQLDPYRSAFSEYLVRTYNQDHLVKKVMESLVDDKLPAPPQHNLLSWMVRNGKKLYIIDQLLPETSDTVIYEYTPAQLKWVEENEFDVWKFFLDENLLYSTSANEVGKYTSPAPNSAGMPAESPGMTANWIGKKIVESYMKRNPKTKIKELLEMNDPQLLLDEARYKPKK